MDSTTAQASSSASFFSSEVSAASSMESSSLGLDSLPRDSSCCSMGDPDQQIPDNVYEFETPALALAGNSDWLAVKQAIVTLQAQRNRAIRNLDKLREAQALAMRDPEAFVDKLTKGKIELPARQKIMEMPSVNWARYTKDITFSTTSRHEARVMHRLLNGVEEEEKNDQAGSEGETDGSVTVVRGRVKDESKPSTFNKLWTPEEQAKLEALLIKYPSELVEARRWKKIAAELGNRTVAQVASRVQKYFIKLAKNNLPIPGRAPSISMTKKAGRPRGYHQYVQHESTFLQSYQPVNMPDNDGDDEFTAIRCPADEHPLAVSDEEDVPEYQRKSDLYREILKLKQLKKMMQVRHVGYACDNCKCEPIVGTRWHCSDCPPSTSVDFCENCTDSSFESESHNSSHRLKPLRSTGDSVLDSDYQSVTRIDNYLDPSFVPFG